MIYCLDSSAILNGAMPLFENIYISPLVISELENIKTSKTLNEHTQYLARQAVRDIISSNNIQTMIFSQNKVEKLLKKYDFLSNINDHRILCEAVLLNEESPITFVTSDYTQYLFAQELPIRSIYYNPENDSEEKIEYCGWSKHYPNEEQMAALYSQPEFNTLGVKTNEYCEIFEGDILKDVLVWTGERYRKLNYKEFTTILGEKIRPRNLEQKMYLDLLQNKDIPVKLCIAKFGTGKSMLALSYALHAIQNGRFEKLIFVKNNLDVKGAGKLGTLPGDEIDKQYPWLRQIEDHIGSMKFEEYLNQNIIEPAHLSSLRGRDLRNSIILADEAENLLTTNIQLLLGRVSSGSEIIFCADVKQCDYASEKMSGIPKLISSLAGDPLFGMVKLLKTERSAVAALADKLD